MRPEADAPSPLIRWVIGHPRALSAGFVALAMGVIAGVFQLEVDFSARAFFGSDGPALAVLDDFQSRWGADDGIIFLGVEARRGDFWDGTHAAALASLGEALEQRPGVKQVQGYWDLVVPIDDNGVLSLEPLSVQLKKSPAAVRTVQAALRASPVWTPLVLSKDAKRTAIAITLDVTADDIAAVRSVVEDLHQTIVAHRSAEYFRFHLGGHPTIRAGLLRLILADQAVFVPAAFLLMAILLALLFQTWEGVWVPLIVAGLPSLFVMGIMGYRSEPIGVVNQVYFTLLPVIAVSGAIHFLSQYRVELDNLALKGVERDRRFSIMALRNTFHEVGSACFLSALTTMVGLLSLQVSQMPVLRNFGAYSAFGVVAALLTLFLFVPFLLGHRPPKPRLASQERKSSVSERVLLTISELVIRRPKTIGCIAVTCVLLAGIPSRHVQVDTKLIDMLRGDHPAAIANRFLDEHLGGLLSLEVEWRGEPGAMTNPGVLAALDAFETRVRALPHVRAVVGPPDLVRQLHLAVVGDHALPLEQRAVGQLLELTADAQLVHSCLSTDRARARISIRTTDMGAQAFRQFESEVAALIEEMTQNMTSSPTPLSAIMTGTASASYRGIARLSTDLRDSILSAFVIIFLLITWVFRSVRIGLIAILPNGLPLLFGYASLGVLDWPLEPGPAVVFTVALGIAVDDTIHLLKRWQTALTRGMSGPDAIRYAIRESGRAVIITTMILMTGFGINALSQFPTNARVGVLGAWVLFCALLGDLIILPALLLLFGRRAPSMVDRGAVATAQRKSDTSA